MPLEQYFPEPRLSMMRAHLRQFARGFGLEDLTSPPRLSNTRRALAIAEYARDEGKLDAFRDAAMTVYWREQAGLDSHEALARAATLAGLDPERALGAAGDPVYQSRVDEHSAQGRAKGVTGIPSFFIGDAFVVGCQPYEVLAEAARHAGAQKR